jgi:segregation and condensation protein A
MNDFVVHIAEYDGPLELLLSIVRKDELPIANLPLAPITAQYLAYIDQATALDVNLTMEWIEMAARLILWKSASLLPIDPELPDVTDFLAQELSRELKELSDRQLAQATDFLSGLALSSERSLNNSAHSDPHPFESGFDAVPASLWTLRKKAQILRDIFRARNTIDRAAYEPTEEGASVEMMASWTRSRLQQIQFSQWFDVKSWFEEVNVVSSRISLFLALLELARTDVIRLKQRNDVLSLWRCQPNSSQKPNQTNENETVP